MRKIFSLLMAIFIAVAAIACQEKSDKIIEEIVKHESSGDEEFYTWLNTHGEDIYDATADVSSIKFDYQNKNHAYYAWINAYNGGDFDLAMYIASEIKSREHGQFDQVKAELMIRDSELQNLYYEKDVHGNLKGLNNEYFVNLDRLFSIIYGIGKSNLAIIESDNYMSGLFDTAKRYIDSRDSIG